MNAFFPIIRSQALVARPSRSFFDRVFDGYGLADFAERTQDWMPAFDVSESEKEITISAEVPGLKAEDMDISLTEGVLTISGEKKHEREENSENFHLTERSFGRFSRSLRVGNEVDAENVEAAYKDGILTVTLPKVAPVEKKKIEIKG